MSAHDWTHPLNVPLFHLHSPHFEWHRVRRPIRAALLAGAVLLTFAVAALAAREAPVAVEPAAPVAREEAREAFRRVDPTRHYQHWDRTVRFEHMYRPDSRARRVEHMYARPSARR